MNPTIHIGESFCDYRGTLKFVNESHPGSYKRFYLITHPQSSIIRAWQGHKIEEKAFYVITGEFIIAVLTPKNFESPDENEVPKLFILSSQNQQFLRVPGGNYTGIKATIPNSTLLVLSGLDLNESKQDDFRQPKDKWIDWNTIS